MNALAPAATDVSQGATSPFSRCARNNARTTSFGGPHVKRSARGVISSHVQDNPTAPGAVAPATSVTRFSQPGFAYFRGTARGNYPRVNGYRER